MTRRFDVVFAILWFRQSNGEEGKMKRVFLSFLSEDIPQVNGLRLLTANPKFDIEFFDESVRTPIRSTNADYIKRCIREKINRTSVTVCFVSSHTYESDWVCWELDESIKKGNLLHFMGLPNGPSTLILPEPGRRLGRPWHSWNLDTLQALIDSSPSLAHDLGLHQAQMPGFNPKPPK
jgi:hypothetical protein